MPGGQAGAEQMAPGQSTWGPLNMKHPAHEAQGTGASGWRVMPGRDMIPGRCRRFWKRIGGWVAQDLLSPSHQ